MTCPNCRNIISKDSDYCIFCGNPFTRKGKSAVLYVPGAKKFRRTAAAKAQRFFMLAALLFGLATFGVILFSPEIPWVASRGAQTPQAVETPAPTPVETAEPSPISTPLPTPVETPEPSPTLSPEPAPTATPEPTPTATPDAEAVSPSPGTSEDPDATPSPDAGGAFYGRSGDYPVVMFLSVADSDDPDTQAAADALMNQRFSGTVKLDIDADGNGTVTVDQAFFSPEPIPVSAFIDSDGVVSDNTLYGALDSGGYRLTVICVCSDDTISGFFWMDDTLTHIEFLYFS